MLTRIRTHLTYANVISTLALFLVVAGGSAYALNTVGSGDVINESLLSQDIKNREVGTNDLAIGAVFGSRVRDNGILASHVVDDTLSGNELTGDGEVLVSGSDLADIPGGVTIPRPDLSSELSIGVAGSHEFVLPLDRLASLYGRNLAIKKANFCFKTNDGVENILDSVQLRRAYGAGSTVVATDDTNRDNTATQCFDFVPPAPVSTNEAASLAFTLAIVDPGQNTFIGPVRLTLAPGS